MRLKYIDTDEYIIAWKPNGIPTHQVSIDKPGFKEFLEQKIGIELGIISRLDSTTSGLIFFPKKQATAKWNLIWQSSQVQKKYIFLSHSKHAGPNSWTTESLITKEKDSWISLDSKEPNSKTQFTFLNQIETDLGQAYLYQAVPITGRTHQIRLHAKSNKIPIIGDTLYKGLPYHRLLLHSTELVIQDKIYQSDLPFWTTNYNEFPLQHEIEKRKNLYAYAANECFRWAHEELTDIRIDQFGPFFYIYDYQKNRTEPNLELIQTLSQYAGTSGFYRLMHDRGTQPSNSEIYFFDATSSALTPINQWKEPQTKHGFDHSETLAWQAKENDFNFQFRAAQGQSPGLFLDQRENRKWVLQNSEQKSVLNLFSYTGGFSVAAALGGALQVCTVDVSPTFISWSKTNFELNGLSMSSKFEFWSTDVFFFLKTAIKKNRKWDIIICDPPTFGRSKEGVFKIDKHLNQLIELSLNVLHNNGTILFSTNYEEWDLSELKRKISTTHKNILVKDTPYQGLDFELPNNNLKMKSLFIKKIN